MFGYFCAPSIFSLLLCFFGGFLFWAPFWLGSELCTKNAAAKFVGRPFSLVVTAFDTVLASGPGWQPLKSLMEVAGAVEVILLLGNQSSVVRQLPVGILRVTRAKF